jgi:hypothetical protein
VISGQRHDPAALSDEQRVFVECVEDILASTPGLRFEVLFDPREIGSRDRSAFALFLIETNPTHDLTVSIELADTAFVIRLNGVAFVRRRGVASRFEWWVERRCRDVERMVAGDLRLSHQTLLNVPATTTLEAGHGSKWRKIASRENGFVAILTFLVPYGFLMGGKKEHLYGDWCTFDGAGGESRR